LRLHSSEYRLTAVLLKLALDLRNVLKTEQVGSIAESADLQLVLKLWWRDIAGLIGQIGDIGEGFPDVVLDLEARGQRVS